MNRHIRNENFVRLAQTRMAALGYYAPPLAIDGDAGSGTLLAFEALASTAPPALRLITAPPARDAPRAPAEGVFNETSLRLLDGVHPRLVDVMKAARREIAFDVIEGVRTLDRQRELVARGASRTLASRHLTGHAVDVWPIDPDTGKRVHHAVAKERERLLWLHLRKVAAAVKAAAKAQGTLVEWGGDWGWDAPHFQLNRAQFP
jgi:peptidoglycan L-alanyl-D-glutamate endopeptidase CwlK